MYLIIILKGKKGVWDLVAAAGMVQQVAKG